jgi:hypothetical protein
MIAVALRDTREKERFNNWGMWLNKRNKVGENMQNAMNREPLRVTQEAVEAYEKRSGFYGIGKKMVEHGRWKIVTKEEVSCTR